MTLKQRSETQISSKIVLVEIHLATLLCRNIAVGFLYRIVVMERRERE